MTPAPGLCNSRMATPRQPQIRTAATSFDLLTAEKMLRVYESSARPSIDKLHCSPPSGLTGTCGRRTSYGAYLFQAPSNKSTPQLLAYCGRSSASPTYQAASCHERFSVVPSVHVRQRRPGDASCQQGRPRDHSLLLTR